MTDKFFIIGMPGAGKTSVGKELSRILSWEFLDTDQIVEQSEGSSIQEIFANFGEQYFRQKESQAIKAVTSEVSAAVVALGGGAVMDAGNSELIKKNGKVIWLKANLATLIFRLTNDTNTIRPLLGKNISENLSELVNLREKIYEKLADFTIDVDLTTVEEAALLIKSNFQPDL